MRRKNMQTLREADAEMIKLFRTRYFAAIVNLC